jgi:membrane-bound metal-dependent hydrolase YbcI (DUF457 family)
MFIGHFAVAFAAKPVAPRISLGTLFLAAQLADLIWPTLVLLGIETFEIRPGITALSPFDFTHYPNSHSLVALAAWGAALGIVYWFVRRARFREAVTLAAVVLSHWILDVVSHRPDMPLTISGPTRIGLGLWNSVPATVAVEFVLLGAGVALYVANTRARDRTGHVALWALVVFLAIAYLASVFGPPPPSPTAVAWGAQSVWLLVAWGYWIDRHRETALR